MLDDVPRMGPIHSFYEIYGFPLQQILIQLGTQTPKGATLEWE